jgi:flagellar hook-length control protein FliK
VANTETGAQAAGAVSQAATTQSGDGHAGTNGRGDTGNPTDTSDGATPATANVDPGAAGTVTGATPAASTGSSNVQSTAGNAASAYAANAVHQPVTLANAIDSVRATFSTISATGVASARISLSPASLGGITVSLSQTSEGLIARLTAEHPETMATLTQNAGQLRQSLADSGINVISLEIGTAGEGAIGGGDSRGEQQPGSEQSPIYSSGNSVESTSTEVDYLVGAGSGNLVDILA